MTDTSAGATAKDAVVEQTARLLDFLAALARDVGTTPARDIAIHGDLVWPDAVPQHAAVRLGPGGESAAWLRVGRVPAPTPPDVPQNLAEHIDPATAIHPDDTPALRVDPELDEWLAKVNEQVQRSPEEVSDETRARADHLYGEQLNREIDLAGWVATVWQPWASRAKAAAATRTLYELLYALHLRAERDEATHEVVWGRALLSWAPPGARIRTPILTVPVTIDIEPDTGAITVAPERAMELELDAVEGLSLPGVEELASLRNRLREEPPDPWSSTVVDEVRRGFVAPLGLNAALTDGSDVPAPGPHPVVNDGWVLFIRPRPVRHERFYTELSRVLIDEQFLPEALASIVADEQQVEKSMTALGQTDSSTAASDVRLLMPLPTNPEQERIARQLASSRGVTVQGPPGTGKSHTIANLISHLVAQGKRVLVTAQNEQALSVLREKIPTELRDLAVAVLGSTPAAMDQVRASVQTVMDSASAIDPDREQRRINELAKQIDDAREQQRLNDLALVEALRSEEREFNLPTGPAKAPDVAQWVSENQHLNLIADRISERTILPLTDEEFDELFTLAISIDPRDAAASLEDLPEAAALPSAVTLAEEHAHLDRLRDTVADLEVAGLRVNALDGRSTFDLAALASRARRAAETLEAISGKWETHVGRALTGESHRVV